jgi:hypothetical protein
MTPNCSGTWPVSIAKNALSVGLARSITGPPGRETLSVIAAIAPPNDLGTRWTRAQSHPLSRLKDVSHVAGARLCLSYRARWKPVLTARSGDGAYQRIEARQLCGSGCPSTAGYCPAQTMPRCGTLAAGAGTEVPAAGARG